MSPRPSSKASPKPPASPKPGAAPKPPVIASIDLSLPAARTVRGYEIGRMPIGRFLRAARRIDGVPQEVLARLFPDAEDAVRALASLDRAGLIGLCARALTVLPDEAVTVFAELAGLDEQALRDDPNVGLDGLMEMIGAWMEVNNLEILSGPRGRCGGGRARGGRALAPTADRHGAEPGHRQAGADGGLLSGRDRGRGGGVERPAASARGGRGGSRDAGGLFRRGR